MAAQRSPFPSASKHTRLTGHIVAAIGLCLALGACASSARFGGAGADVSAVRQAQPIEIEPIEPAPSTRVETTPLPPPPGAASAPPIDPGPVAGTPPPSSPQAPQVAVVNPVPQAPARPTQTSVTGNWALAEGAGNRCRVTLSSVSKLDLYGASTSGCQSRELRRVVAWELQGDTVVLYETGGSVAARLKSAGGQSFSGSSARSGAPLTLSK